MGFLGLAVIGALFLLWGLNILFNNRFYEWWRDRYWREPNDGQLSRESLIYNRYIDGAGYSFLGAVLLYVAFSVRMVSDLTTFAPFTQETLIDFGRLFLGGLLQVYAILLIGNERVFQWTTQLLQRNAKLNLPKSNYPKYILGLSMIGLGVWLIY